MTNKTYSRLAGASYLILIAMGIFAEFFVRSNLIVSGDAMATAEHIIASVQQFRMSIAADLIMLICDVLLAWLLYVLLMHVNKNLALLAAFFRLVHAAVYGLNLLNLFFVLRLLNGDSFLSVYTNEQLNALVLLFLNAHSSGYLIGLVFFGIHCLVLGYLVIKSHYVPSVLGMLLIIAGGGYLTDSFANFLLPSYENYQTLFMMIVFIPAFVAELLFSFWLLIKGIQNSSDQTIPVKS
ncbi:MAG: DUF4386 domain-containing protein [Calditrichaeota bacterium]|nr:DUF4386 domain-containing protein [Calditrichota bacterium]